MPYAYIEPDIFLEHQGVTVFCTYSDTSGCAGKYWFTLDPNCADEPSWNSGERFDARLFAGFASTPSVGKWDAWWKPRFREEREAVEALIRTAIEDGKLRAPEARAA